MPFLLNSTTPNPYIFFGYETILTLSLLWYALKNRYQYLYMISYAVAAIVLFCLLCCYVNVSRGFASPVNSSLWFNSLTIILAYVYGEKFYSRATLGDI